MLIDLLALLIGYFLGSIPFGLILTAQAGLGDIRAIGSGNIGATNVLRTGNKTIAALTLVLDAGKGALAVLLADYVAGGLGAIAALGAVLGHLFPAWLGFKGGKGVSTTIGVLLALDWPIGLVFLATWLAVAMITRISSASALIAIALAPLVALVFGQPGEARFIALIALLVWAAHRDNVRRLYRGEESRIGGGGK